MESDSQEQSQSRHYPRPGRFLTEVRLHSTGKANTVDKCMDGEAEHGHPTGDGGGSPVLVVMLATRFVIVVHLQLARYFVGVRRNEALDAKQAHGAKGH